MIPWTTAHQASLSVEFSRQEYWSGLQFPSPGDLPNSGIEPRSPTSQAESLLAKSPGKSTYFFFYSFAFSMIQNMMAIWSLVPLTFLNPACTSEKFSVHVLLKPALKDFEHNLAGMWNECNCTVIWTFFGIAFLWDWNEKCPFPVLWPLLSFPYLLA